METVNANNDFISDIFHDGASPPVERGQVQTMKIPLSPPFPKGDNYPSLWQREVGRDLKKLFSNR
jgi:hypothetical protein